MTTLDQFYDNNYFNDYVNESSLSVTNKDFFKTIKPSSPQSPIASINSKRSISKGNNTQFKTDIDELNYYRNRMLEVEKRLNSMDSIRQITEEQVAKYKVNIETALNTLKSQNLNLLDRIEILEFEKENYQRDMFELQNELSGYKQLLIERKRLEDSENSYRLKCLSLMQDQQKLKEHLDLREEIVEETSTDFSYASTQYTPSFNTQNVQSFHTERKADKTLTLRASPALRQQERVIMKGIQQLNALLDDKEVQKPTNIYSSSKPTHNSRKIQNNRVLTSVR
eukprot:TRINITY_DN3571_c0_g1_i1.p1 TRINITY_DN3571_c0_g1~~TRINITY_DN3571_c0_g1_i1.p1  ORF type:complete len:282 (-),score=79.40 TRINITY_DN3571_c0_g1_i1:204-1049(-)